MEFKANVRGYSSVVERHLAKVHVARSNRVTRLPFLKVDS